MPDEQIHRTLGEHTAEIRGLQEDMTEVKGDVKSILAILSEAKGSWKLLVMIATASSGLTLIISKAIAAFQWVPK